MYCEYLLLVCGLPFHFIKCGLQRAEYFSFNDIQFTIFLNDHNIGTLV